MEFQGHSEFDFHAYFVLKRYKCDQCFFNIEVLMGPEKVPSNLFHVSC